MLSKKIIRIIIIIIFAFSASMFSNQKLRKNFQVWNVEKIDIPGGGCRPMIEMEPDYMIIVDYMNLEPTLEQYKIKIEKVFLDSKEAKIDLNFKRKELTKKLFNLTEIYKTNDNVKKEIQEILKSLKQVNDRIMAINKEAMEKIKKLNEEREKEIDKAVNEWIKKMEIDKDEFDRFIKFLNERKNKIPFKPNYNNPFMFKRFEGE